MPPRQRAWRRQSPEMAPHDGGKLLRASCSVHIAPCKWLPARGQVALRKLLLASCSLQVALCKLLCASCSRQGALRKLVCASCSAQVALRKLVCASCSAQVALRKLICATCSAQVALRKLFYASCSAHLAKPARGPGGNRTHDPLVPEAGARTTRQLPRTTTAPIPAEGRVS